MPWSVMYSFTITLLPRLYKYSPEDQYDHTYMNVAEVLRGLSSRVELIAELTPKNMNVHYHGKIQFQESKEDCRKKFIDAFRGSKLVGFVSITQTEDDKGWYEYIHKDVVTTKKLIGRPPIILHDFESKIELDILSLYSFDCYI